MKKQIEAMILFVAVLLDAVFHKHQLKFARASRVHNKMKYYRL